MRDALTELTRLTEELIPGAYVASHIRIARVPGAEVEGSEYAGFVFGTAARSGRGAHRRLARELKRPGCFVYVAWPSEGERVFVGWLAACALENRIVYAYTKAAYRASPEQRSGNELNVDAFRIASTLAVVAGISFERPVECSFFSRAARAIASKTGNPYNLRFDAKEPTR